MEVVVASMPSDFKGLFRIGTFLKLLIFISMNDRKSLEIGFRRWIAGNFPSKKIVKYLDIKDKEIYVNQIGSKGEIDHIIPLSFFDLSNYNDIRLAWCVDNLRRVEKMKNKNKGASIESAYAILLENKPINQKNYLELLAIARSKFEKLHPNLVVQKKLDF